MVGDFVGIRNDTTVPVLAKGKTDTGRLWGYVRDDRPFAGTAPPAAIFRYSRDRRGEHPEEHLRDFTGILQADAYAGYNGLYDAERKPAPVSAAFCWAHSRRKFFELADIAARRRGPNAPPIPPLALEAVTRIDAPFEHRTRDQRPPTGGTDRRSCRAVQTLGWGTRDLDADRTDADVETRFRRQGHELHVDPLGRLHPLPRRRSDLSHHGWC